MLRVSLLVFSKNRSNISLTLFLSSTSEYKRITFRIGVLFEPNASGSIKIIFKL